MKNGIPIVIIILIISGIASFIYLTTLINRERIEFHEEQKEKLSECLYFTDKGIEFENRLNWCYDNINQPN